MQNKRINFIDLAKGIAIFLVVVGHIETIPFIKSTIYSFHIPLFFLLSGYFVDFSKDFGFQVKKMFRSLIVPYLVIGVIWLIINPLANGLNANTLEVFLYVPLVIWRLGGEIHSVGAICRYCLGQRCFCYG